LVDDQPEILRALQVFLHYSFKDLDIRSASSATEALDLLSHDHVDLVVADYLMPGMDGLHLLEEVGRVAPDTRRILFTGHSEDAAHAESATGMAERILAKSVPLEELIEHVQGLWPPPDVPPA
jgi:DNA-binding NarL/FixJ family response regulator